MPKTTAKMTSRFWSSARDELSVSRTIGLIGFLLCHSSGSGPEAGETVESTDQLTGTPTALT